MAAANILFFSPDDDYSRQVMGMVEQIRNQFVIVDVNNKQYTLPPFVDRVPMILIKASNQLVIDENIPIYVQTLFPKVSSSAASFGGNGGNNNIDNSGEMLTMSDVGRGISDNFSFLNGANTGGGSYEFLDAAMVPQNQQYQQQQQQHQQHNTGPAIPNGRCAPNGGALASIDTSKQARLDPADLERFTAQRDMDMAAFKR